MGFLQYFGKKEDPDNAQRAIDKAQEQEAEDRKKSIAQPKEEEAHTPPPENDAVKIVVYSARQEVKDELEDAIVLHEPDLPPSSHCLRLQRKIEERLEDVPERLVYKLAVARLLPELVREVPRIDPEDLRHLLALLQDTETPEKSIQFPAASKLIGNARPHLQHVLEMLCSVYELLNTFHNTQYGEGTGVKVFCQRTRDLIRATHRGINVVRWGLKGAAGIPLLHRPAVLDARKQCRFNHAGVDIVIQPLGTKSLISSPQVENATLTLENGKEVMVGRAFVFHDVFGIDMGEDLGITKEKDKTTFFPIEGRGAVSRASIRLIRSADGSSLALYDCGTTNGLQGVSGEGIEAVEFNYSPRPKDFPLDHVLE